MNQKDSPKSEVFSFRTSDKNTIIELKQKNKTSDFLSELMQLYFSGKLITLEESMKIKELSELKFRDYKARVITKELNAKIIMLRGLKVSPDDIAKIMDNKKSIFDVSATKEIKQLDGTLRCITCGKKIEMRAYNFQQVEDYSKHIKDKHDRDYNQIYETERKVFLEMLGEPKNVS